MTRCFLVAVLLAATLITAAMPHQPCIDHGEQTHSGRFADRIKDDEPSMSPGRDVSAASGTSLRWLRHDGRLRSYWLHVPPGYNGTAIPLVVVLHAGGSYPARMATKTGFTEKADEETFIVVYPRGVYRWMPWWRMWNGGYCCGVAYEHNVDDVGFVAAMIAELRDGLAINGSRIYVTGHSNGAILAYRVAAELSDVVAAVGPVAGSIGGTASADSPLWVIPQPAHPVSVIHFHGLLDENVPYDGGHGNNTWGTGTDLPVNASISFWVEHNNCSHEPERWTSDSGNITRDTYTGGENGSMVTLYTIVNGGHGWPGSSIGDRPSQEISATELMWSFFQAHPKR
jgi:polyhydroxybutyrate depolymerase